MVLVLKHHRAGAHGGCRFVIVCFTVWLWLHNDLACDKCPGHMGSICWPSSTVKSHCLLLIAMNCSYNVEVNSPIHVTVRGIMCAVLIEGKAFIWLKLFVKKEQHNCRKLLSCEKNKSLVIKMQSQEFLAVAVVSYCQSFSLISILV